jgi:hypothetical protein
MKRLFFLFLIGFSVPAVNAQVLLGVKGGINFSTITGRDYGEVKTITGLNAGILASIPLFSRFSLQPELAYSGEGAQSTEDNVTGTLHLHYLTIPILFKYQNSTGIFLETGPQLGHLSKAEFQFTNFSEDEKSNFQSTDFAWAFGIGYLFKGVNLGVDARYNLGLANFIADSYIGNAKNNVMQVGLFFLFSIKAGANNHS